MNSPEENAAWFVAQTRRRGVVCGSVLIRELGTGSENPSLLATRSGFPSSVPRCLGKQGERCSTRVLTRSETDLPQRWSMSYANLQSKGDDHAPKCRMNLELRKSRMFNKHIHYSLPEFIISRCRRDVD